MTAPSGSGPRAGAALRPRARTLTLVALLAASATALGATGLELAAELEDAPGDITVTPDGQLLVSLHPHFRPRMKVVRLRPGGSPEPFPDAAWNRDAPGASDRFDSVPALMCDPTGVVWILDSGRPSGLTPRLLGWNIREDRLEKVIHLPGPVTRPGSNPCDLVVDRVHEAVYIADPASGPDAALIVVDLGTGASRRVLEGHPSLVPEDVDLVVDGRRVTEVTSSGAARPLRQGVTPLALDAARQWLYLGPMHGRSLHRIRVEALLGPGAGTGPGPADAVEWFAGRPPCDGISIDTAGHIYLTEMATGSIGLITPAGAHRTFLGPDPQLSWPHALSFAPDGHLYVVASQLHLGPGLNAGRDEARRPFLVLRFRPEAPGIAGR